MAIRNSTWMVLVALLLSACASEYLGKRYPEAARYACRLDSKNCSLQWRKDNWALEGAYAVDEIDVNRYRVHGRLKVDTTGLLPAYTHSRVILNFHFFRSDTVVEELNITVRGEVNKFNEFSKILVTDEQLDSSIFGFSSFRVADVPI